MAYFPMFVDNRGTDAKPYGFVYLRHSSQGKKDATDEMRVGFGAHRDNGDRLALWAVRDTPSDMKIGDVRRVRDFLAAALPEPGLPDASPAKLDPTPKPGVSEALDIMLADEGEGGGRDSG